MVKVSPSQYAGGVQLRVLICVAENSGTRFIRPLSKQSLYLEITKEGIWGQNCTINTIGSLVPYNIIRSTNYKI